WTHNCTGGNLGGPRGRSGGGVNGSLRAMPGSNSTSPRGNINIGVVRSRINIANGPTRFSLSRNAGWKHVADRHFSPGTNAGQFTVSQSEVKGILQQKSTINTPISSSTNGQYSRLVNTGRTIGTVKPSIPAFGGSTTKWMQVITDVKGNLITTYPVPGP
ncbi:hypothetical protein Q5741_21280, partial [Paenibacillus sp. JX-17]|nr:hypothetical protein [Paenibacillus sp. JX-17]